MSGHDFRSAGGDPSHRAPNREFSYSSKAGPRSSPPLFATKEKLTAEPRSHVSAPSINQTYDSDQDYGSNNYTTGSGLSDPYANPHGTWYTKPRHDEEEIEHRLASLKFADTPREWGVDPGTNDSKDIPRSYAEVVKTSPVISPAQPSYQAAPPRPKSPKKTCRETRRSQVQHSPACGAERSLQKHPHSVERGVKSLTIRNTGGHNQAVGHGATRSTKNHQPVARGVTLDENNLHTNYQRKSTNLEHIYSRRLKNDLAAINIRSGHNGIVRAKSAGQLSASVSDNTIGIGGWAGSACDHGPPLSPELPRIDPTDSLGPQRLLPLDAVVQCASGDGNSKPSGCNKPAAHSNSRANRQTGGGREGKQNKGKRPNQKANKGEGDDDGSDGNSDELEEPKSRPDPSIPRKWFPCPFHKLDPLHYTTNEATRKLYMSCAGKWDDMARLKEHIYRVHCDPYTCDRCQEEFKTKKLLKAHQSNSGFASCTFSLPKPRIAKEISTDIQDRLRERPKRGMSDEDRWFAIWDLLFPGVERPSSPYADAQEAESFQDFLAQRMAQRMHVHFSANLSTALDRMGLSLSEEQKRQLTAVAIEQEKASRDELLDLFQKKDSPSPGPAYEESEHLIPTNNLPVGTASGLQQYSQNYFTQPSDDISRSIFTSTSDHRQQLGPYFDPQPSSIFPQPTTPGTPGFRGNYERLRPSSPAQYSSSEISGDSGYRSTGAVSNDGCINPALLNTPSQRPRLKRTISTRNMNGGYGSHPMCGSQGPIPTDRQTWAPHFRLQGNLDTPMENGYPDDPFSYGNAHGSGGNSFQ